MKNGPTFFRDGQTTRLPHILQAPTLSTNYSSAVRKLRKDLTRTFGALATSDEQTVLLNIKSLAVRQENIMVARVQLQQMRQDHDEPVRSFSARLRGQAGVCNFKVGCSCSNQVDYSDMMIRDALNKGLADDEIRLDILGESKQDMSLEEVLKFAEAKESGKRSAGRLLGGGTTSTAAVTSSYKRQEKNRMNSQTNEATPSLSLCGHCGKPGHGRSRQERQRKCTAYNPRVQNAVHYTTMRKYVVGQSANHSPPFPPLHHCKMMQQPFLRHCALLVMSLQPTLMQ